MLARIGTFVGIVFLLLAAFFAMLAIWSGSQGVWVMVVADLLFGGALLTSSRSRE